jgi:hypothetical protein
MSVFYTTNTVGHTVDPDKDPFVYIDTAIGGASRRNNVMRLDEYKPGARTDCFRTFCRFTEDFKHYTAQNVNGGKPSVAGYPGPGMADIVPFDFDCKEDLALAFKDARTCVRSLEARYDVPLEALGVYFSGCKGFSVELPTALLGGVEPTRNIAEVLKSIAMDVAGARVTLDTGIYENLRLWRTPNTRHGRSGLYKIPLKVAELLSADLQTIKGLATRPRELVAPAPDEFGVSSSLREVYKKALSSPTPQKERKLYDGPVGEKVPLLERLEEWGVDVLREVSDIRAEVKFAILCPWIAEHTTDPKTGTYVLQYESGGLFFECHHSHCEYREWADFREKVSPVQKVRFGRRRYRRIYAVGEEAETHA